MSRPPEPIDQLRNKGKSHITKLEVVHRKKAEQALLTKIKFKEKKDVRNNPIAHKEFLRVKKLFMAIDKMDGLYENIVNRYCQLFAEGHDFEEKREVFYDGVLGLETSWANGEMKDAEYYKLRTAMQGQVIALDKQIMQKRSMMLAIEKECVMTIAGALRSIPKKPKEKSEQEKKVDKLFGGRA